ncbi:MAG TPA: DUF998 domain-containing protein [Gammaproteobacteria bacterium]|jgi:hypothetical membrane protein
MKRSVALLFGPLGAAIFCVGVLVLAAMVPGYSHVHQTVSEIGAMGTPLQIPFTALLICVGLCMWVFAWGIWQASAAAGRNRFTALLLVCAGISCVGVGIFSTPHPLHNVFGLSEIVGYQAPLAFALAWRKAPKAQLIVAVSWLFFVLLWVSMGLNMSMMRPDSGLAMAVMPIYGLVQRSLFLVWFGWCAIVGVLLWRREHEAAK